MFMKLRMPTSIAFLLSMTLLTGLVYPLVVTGFAQLLFPAKANGSLLVIDGEIRGSTLLAQKFESASYFAARPSATDYAWVGSGASNLAATNPLLAASVEERREAWEARYGGEAPADQLYASASGLDPDISLEAALGQLDSVALARGLGLEGKEALAVMVRSMAMAKTSLLGPPRVNVIELNAELATNSAFAAAR